MNYLDFSTREGADYLVKTIKAYWENLGKQVKVWAEPSDVDYAGGKRGFYIIKSNLKNGLPE